MKVDPSTLDKAGNYFFLISAVVPRPIAWVTTRDGAGTVNLAPFSFFQGVSSNPPTIMLAFGRRRDGSLKDTHRNIVETGEFVVNLVSEDATRVMVESSADLPPDESEVEKLGLEVLPSERVAPPRLALSAVSLECRLDRHLPVGSSTVVFGEVLLYHVEDAVLDEKGRVDAERLRPVARLGGNRYAALGRIFDEPRPG
jgi:flavin reductase (DIM6/NTAB) family NADH-FMN oxidoreductase RutF